MHSAHPWPPPAAALQSFHTAGRDGLSFGLGPFKKKNEYQQNPYTPASHGVNQVLCSVIANQMQKS
jgi:hypothetical protein